MLLQQTTSTILEVYSTKGLFFSCYTPIMSKQWNLHIRTWDPIWSLHYLELAIRGREHVGLWTNT